MDTDNIVRLSLESVRELIDSLRPGAATQPGDGKRREQRWPFPGTVEVWLPESCYGERYLLATLHNLSSSGLAMRCDRPVPTQTRIQIAVHVPKLSCYGEAIVRHCTRAIAGYLIGVEFILESDEPAEDSAS